jgi:hypothetical protein
MNTTTSAASQVLPETLSKLFHLSEEQIEDHLIGDLDGVAAAHLAECTECSVRVADAAQPLVSFRQFSSAWSERRSATMPLPAVEADLLVWQRRAGWAMAACVLLVGVSFAGNNRNAEMLRASDASVQSASTVKSRPFNVPLRDRQTAPDESAVRVATEDDSSQYAGDNRMLKAIDTELDASVETPAAMGLDPLSDEPRSQISQPSVED